MPKIFKRQIGAFAFFLLLACLVLYWLLFHATTHVPGESMTDYFHFHWNFWWIRHALTTPGVNVYQTDYVLFPFKNNLALHTLAAFWFPLWAVVEPFFGTLVAVDVIFIVALALAGYFCFMLLRREGVTPGMALTGSIVFQLTPSLYGAVWLSDINYVGFFWIPLQLLLWGQVARSLHRRPLLWALLQGLSLYAMTMTDPLFLLFSAFILIPYGVWTLLALHTLKDRLRLMALGSIALVVMIVLLWFAGPLPYMFQIDRSQLAPPPADQTHSIPFPEGYFSRNLNYRADLTLGSFVIPVSLITVIASLTLFRNQRQDRRRWIWLGLVVVPLILSAGATITIAGLPVPMPYRVLHELLGRLFRDPERFGTVAIVPLMLFVGLAWRPWLTNHARLRLPFYILLVFLVLLDARLFWPLPIQPVMTHYDFYDKMGQERGAPYDNYVVLEVPVAGGSGVGWIGQLNQVATQFYGMTHGKRMVNGLISRVPSDHFWYLRTDDAMLSWLGQRRLLDKAAVEKQLRDRIFNWPIGYVVVHQDLIGLNSSTNQEIIGYFNSLPDLLCPYTVEGAAVVYRTAWHPDGCPARTPPEISPGIYQIDIGATGDERFIGWGWHYAENISGVTLRWAGDQPQAQVYVDLPPAAYDISISAQAFWQPRSLQLLVNGNPVSSGVTVPTDTLTTFNFHVPAELIGAGKHVTLTLAYDGWTVPAQVQPGTDQRKLAIAVDWIRLARQGS